MVSDDWAPPLANIAHFYSKRGGRPFTSALAVDFNLNCTPSLTKAAQSSCCIWSIQKVPSFSFTSHFWISAALPPKLLRNSRLSPTLEEKEYTSFIDIHSGSFCSPRLISSVSNNEKGWQDTAAAPSFITAALLLNERVRSARSLSLLGLAVVPSHPLQ